ncbi:hypothetical protein ACIBVL_08720 [Streptomyces sp. NPDC049687]
MIEGAIRTRRGKGGGTGMAVSDEQLPGHHGCAGAEVEELITTRDR